MKSLSNLLIICATLSLSAGAYGPEKPEWRSVNDTVMGGVSNGGPVEFEEGLVRFAGILSLENNGGFSSIRSDSPDYAISNDGDIVLTLRGDGRTYSFDLRTRVRQGAFSYKQYFDTQAGEDMEIRLPLSGFQATSFGRRVPMAASIDPSEIVSIGVMLSDKKAGPFRLDIYTIDFEVADEPVVKKPADLIELAIQRGVPMYNRGDKDACAAVYETTLHALMMMPEETVSDSVKKQVSQHMESMKPGMNHSERAWAMRRALDQAHASLSQSEMQL